jgi:hypothetical protein
MDETTKELLARLNNQLKSYNVPELGLVKPEDCLGQDKNARYFTPEVFQQLVDNVKADGQLESVPLVYPHPDIEGKYLIISGHHRIDAAKQAKLEYVLVFVIRPTSQDEIISKQLSHNALVGMDDKAVLAEIFSKGWRLDFRMRSKKYLTYL